MNALALADRAGITYRQVDHWCHRGYLNAVGGSGSGSERIFQPEEVRVAVDMARLVNCGITPVAAARLARELQRSAMADLGFFHLVRKVDAA